MDSSESEQHSQRRSLSARGSTANFRPSVQAREAEDGRRLLGVYTSEAEEEIRGVGFVNHQSTGNLSQRVGRRPQRVAARVTENGDQALGFCKSEAKEEICSVSFAKGWRKTNRSQGRIACWVYQATVQTKKKRNISKGNREEKKRERERRKNNAMKIVGNMNSFWWMGYTNLNVLS